MTAGLSDNWDDAEGYYRARMGEVLDGRYQVMESHGRGVFSTVVKAKDLQSVVSLNTDADPQTQTQNVGAGEYSEVALKVIRANETMYKAAQLEITVCKKLMDADPENKRHCVRFLRSFEFRDHVFMVFESMHMNLREVIKKYGRDVGLNVHGVRSFATQMLISLRHLKNCGVVHADIKPDNILVNGSHNVIKICDFGSAMFDGDNEITPYLQSRFYRAPEVILGLPYSHPMDLWSIGCCLYELYMGKIAFQGRSNNEMMKKFIEAKGPVPRKLLRRAVFRDNHYNHEGVFSVVEDDPVTRQAIRRLIRDAKPVKELSAVLAAHDKNLGEAERRKVSQLADLLDKIFTFDPEKRITVTNALTHPFIKEGIAAPLP
jgi:serine/threonine-protein kinase PRP4